MVTYRVHIANARNKIVRLKVILQFSLHCVHQDVLTRFSSGQKKTNTCNIKQVSLRTSMIMEHTYRSVSQVFS